MLHKNNAVPASIDVKKLIPPGITASGNNPGSSPAESSDPAATQNDDDVIARLARLKPLDYDRVRVEQANLMRCRPAILDNLVKAVRKEDGVSTGLPFPKVEPWHEPIDPSELFDEISSTIRRFIVIGPEQADTSALWIVHTHLVDEFDISPILAANSPEPECAKTIFQITVASMSYRSLPAANASASALFRAVELWGPTIFFDEADTFFRDKPDLQGMVNAGYKRGGFVLRSEAVGDSFEPKMFSVYSAKSIAGIALDKHLPDATMSRAIVINLRRKLPHETVSRLRHAEDGLFEVITAKIARFALDYARQVRLARPELPDALSDRAGDNWESLLAIAECAGPVWLARAINAALKLSGAGEKSVSTGNELLADIRDIFVSKSVLKISTADLIEALCEDTEKSWATYSRGKPLSPRQLARLLSGYNIKSKTVRMKYETPKGFDTAQFQDAFSRYLAPPVNLPQLGHDSPDSNHDGGVEVADAESGTATQDEKVY